MDKSRSSPPSSVDIVIGEGRICLSPEHCAEALFRRLSGFGDRLESVILREFHQIRREQLERRYPWDFRQSLQKMHDFNTVFPDGFKNTTRCAIVLNRGFSVGLKTLTLLVTREAKPFLWTIQWDRNVGVSPVVAESTISAATDGTLAALLGDDPPSATAHLRTIFHNLGFLFNEVINRRKERTAQLQEDVGSLIRSSVWLDSLPSV